MITEKALERVYNFSDNLVLHVFKRTIFFAGFSIKIFWTDRLDIGQSLYIPKPCQITIYTMTQLLSFSKQAGQSLNFPKNVIKPFPPVILGYK